MRTKAQVLLEFFSYYSWYVNRFRDFLTTRLNCVVVNYFCRTYFNCGIFLEEVFTGTNCIPACLNEYDKVFLVDKVFHYANGSVLIKVLQKTSVFTLIIISSP